MWTYRHTFLLSKTPSFHHRNKYEKKWWVRYRLPFPLKGNFLSTSGEISCHIARVGSSFQQFIFSLERRVTTDGVVGCWHIILRSEFFKVTVHDPLILN